MARVIRIYADEVAAGDYIVLNTDRGRRVYHVCEVGVNGRTVTIVFNAQGGFVRKHYDADERIKVREE